MKCNVISNKLSYAELELSTQHQHPSVTIGDTIRGVWWIYETAMYCKCLLFFAVEIRLDSWILVCLPGWLFFFRRTKNNSGSNFNTDRHWIKFYFEIFFSPRCNIAHAVVKLEVLTWEIDTMQKPYRYRLQVNEVCLKCAKPEIMQCAIAFH